MADEFADDFLDEEEIKQPSNGSGEDSKDKNKIWLILIVAVFQTVLAIFIVDQLVLPARAELLEANEELLVKVQQERLAIEKKIDELQKLALNNGVEEPEEEKEMTGLDASRQGVIHVIKDFVINAGGIGSDRLILVDIGLEFDTEETVAAMSAKEIILKDRIINIIQSKAIEDIDENKEQVALRNEIKKSLSVYLPEEAEIYNVYISKLLIQ